MATLDESFKKLKDVLNAEKKSDHTDEVIAELTLASIDVLEVFFKNIQSIDDSLRQIAKELPMIRGKL